MLAQQPTQNAATMMNMNGMPAVNAQAKQALVQTSQELQARTVSETAASSGMKASAQKPTSGAIDLEGDMLQVTSQTDNGLKIQQELTRRAPVHSVLVAQGAQLNQMSSAERKSKDQFD